MANEEHLDILKQGVEGWNTWRMHNPNIYPDLSDAYLTGATLREANFSRANLSFAILRDADLMIANFSSSFLSGADLSGANLSGANLSTAMLIGTILSGTNLSDANLVNADLKNANLSEAKIGWTSFGDRDLRVIKGLRTIIHEGPSPLSINTVYLSRGDIPEAFLKDAGIDDSFIAYMRSLVNNPIDYYTCFISYSSKDQAFAERLHADLQSKGVRCWFAPEDMKIGDKIRSRIDESIQLFDKLLLVLSENSIESAWVEKEVETAFEKERKQNKTVLFPIRLDDGVMNTDQAWAADIRRTRNIGDFRGWKRSHDKYQKVFERLLRDLKAEG